MDFITLKLRLYKGGDMFLYLLVERLTSAQLPSPTGMGGGASGLASHLEGQNILSQASISCVCFHFLAFTRRPTASLCRRVM